MKLTSPFKLMNTVFLGFWISLSYGAASVVVLLILGEGESAFDFWEAYTREFRSILSLGLILGTALAINTTQKFVPGAIEDAFSRKELAQTAFKNHKDKFFSSQRSALFSAKFIIASFIIFSLCQFPLEGSAEYFLIVPACLEYGLGVYIGRKLVYAGMMTHSLLDIRVTRNLFKDHKLDDINSYVNIMSSLTIVFVYIHVNNYYQGPFLYDSPVNEGVRVFLLLPALLATPVLLIFNFYPRIVLRQVYSQSIDLEIIKLQEKLRNEKLSTFERRSYLIEFDKMSRDELRYRLRLTLSDLPIGITIFIMVLGPLLAK